MAVGPQFTSRCTVLVLNTPVLGVCIGRKVVGGGNNSGVDGGSGRGGNDLLGGRADRGCGADGGSRRSELGEGRNDRWCGGRVDRDSGGFLTLAGLCRRSGGSSLASRGGGRSGRGSCRRGGELVAPTFTRYHVSGTCCMRVYRLRSGGVDEGCGVETSNVSVDPRAHARAFRTRRPRRTDHDSQSRARAVWDGGGGEHM